MQYLILGYDGKDKDALMRRICARAEHLALGSKLIKEGKLHYGVAMLDEKERMIGSVYVCEFASKKELNAWLKVEPYVTGKVWKKITISPCKVGPSFSK